MRLTEIRLAGFKSFSEPVRLRLEHRLTGVVGPNGCGKSNIVDALTWVMGESSARHLRGETLADVICNGGGQQPPASRAQVELLFDNEDGRIGGRLAGYREISIRRTLDRDGESGYFLNSTPCRRKDIQALFRGTGLGPRSYAVIEQGMISRLVEARPEELRAHLEEAAGVSRYRVARRETGNRMRHTRENLARLGDLRQEVQDRIRKLERQARQAERYRELSARRKRLQAELLALEWRELDRLCGRGARERAERTRALETARARLSGLSDQLERERSELDALERECETLQRECYQANSGIEQREQSITHAQERIAALERELERVRGDVVHGQEQLGAERRAAEELENRRAVLHAQDMELHAAEQRAEERLNRAEQAVRAGELEWERATREHTEAERLREALDARVRYLRERMRELERQDSLRMEERDAIDPGAADRELEQRQGDLHQAEQRRRELERDEREHGARLAAMHAAVAEAQRDLDSGRLAHQELHAGLSSLEALQQAELGKEAGAEMQRWLDAHGLADRARLGERIRIAPRWRRSVELALGAQLRAVEVARLEDAARDLDALPGGEFSAYSNEADDADGVKEKNGPLPGLREAAGVSGLPAELLAGVYAAENLEQALSARARLAPGEYIATPDGVLVGRGWLRATGGRAHRGILQRSGELESLRARHAESERRCRELEQRLGTLRAEAERQQALHEELRHRLKEQQEQWSERRSTLAVGMEQLEQRQARAARLTEELEQIGTEKNAVAAELGEAEAERERLISTRRRAEAERARLQQTRRELEDERTAARAAWQQAKDEHHRTALELESATSRRTSLLESAAGGERTVAQLQERCRELEQECVQAREPLPGLRALQKDARQALQRLSEKLDVQQTRRAARRDAWKARDEERTTMERDVREREGELHRHELNVREQEVRRKTVSEQMQEAGVEAAPLLANLDAERSVEAQRAQLESLQTAIERIGAVHLGAVEEREELEERERYLGTQHADLEQSLATLERAMRRMDRESRRRFLETLEQVHAHLSELFPALFGGGSARLVPDNGNPLEGGLRFMAHPPGKRNTSIHLLSGGEKALAALALVFAIFRLNPAPLCVLDEVDAPLDDNNVTRYCELVRSMAGQVQFIIVTHNKLTMELADTLLGITMQEAGVSRIVGVNVEEAVELADCA